MHRRTPNSRGGLASTLSRSLALLVATIALVIGTVFGFGADAGADELDMDEVNAQALQTLAINGESVVDVAYTGYNAAAAVTADGDLYTWGENYCSQLGYRSTTQSNPKPRKVPGIDHVVGVALKTGSGLAFTSDGSLYAWGSQSEFQDVADSGDPTPQLVRGIDGVVSVALGSGHGAAVTSDGSLYTWGGNDRGQLGIGTRKNNYRAPEKVPSLSDVVSVSLGNTHSAAITADGSLYTWGYNGYGQLGDGTKESRLSPKKVRGLGNVVSVSLGTESSAAITSDGSLYTWGDNYYGILGDGTWDDRYSPGKVEDLSGVVAFSFGGWHSAAVTEDGTVYTWGRDNWGQLGKGDERDELTPSPVPGVSNVTAVSLGHVNSAAITSDGSLYAWGANIHGNLGDNTDVNSRSTPTLIFQGTGQQRPVNPSKPGDSQHTGSFVLGRDNNSYQHYDGNASHGFYGVKNYSLPMDIFNKLTASEVKTEGINLLDEENSEWTGSCFGIAATMALVHSGDLKLSNITRSDASTYYDLPLPYKDSKLLNSINYYQLSQYLIDPTALYWNEKSYKALTELLRLLEDGQTPLFCFGYRNDDGDLVGHAIVACDVVRDSDGYTFELYDENCISSKSSSKGKFIYMKASSDLGTFSFTDANGTPITNSTCKYFEVISPEDLYQRKPYLLALPTLTPNNVVFPMDADFTLTASDGSTLTYSSDGTFGGSMMSRISEDDILPITNDDESQLKVTLPKSATYTLTGCSSGIDMSVYSSEDYLSIAGEGIDEAELNLGKSIVIDGAAGKGYSFEGYLSTNERASDGGDARLVSVSGSASGKMTIAYDENAKQINAESDGTITNGKATTLEPSGAKDLADQDMSGDRIVVGTDPDAGSGGRPGGDDPSGGDQPANGSVDMYRMYNPYSGEHLYTSSATERATMVGNGWDYEGVMWRAPMSSDTPIYRLYNPYSGDHHYAKTRQEYDQLCSTGWRGEDVAFYSAGTDGIPIYRLFNPYQTGVGTHHYTDSTTERDANRSSGWRDEGIGWYGLRDVATGSGDAGSGGSGASEPEKAGVKFLIWTIDKVYEEEDAKNHYDVDPSHYISGVSYVIRDANGRIVSQGTTEQGKAIVTLPEDTYYVVLSKQGYKDFTHTLRLEAGTYKNYMYYMTRV